MKLMSKNTKDKKIKKLPPARTPEQQEDRCINLAYKEAEKQLLNGTASSQVINHFLKLGSSKEKLEKNILSTKSKLMNAQIEEIQDTKKNQELYEQAIQAMQSYSSSEDSDENIQ